MFVIGLRFCRELCGSVDNYLHKDLLERALLKVNPEKPLPRFLGVLALGIVASKESRRARGNCVGMKASKFFEWLESKFGLNIDAI